MNTVQPETQETGEGGAVSASPLPVSPSPTGRYPIDTVPREETTTSRSHLTLPEILFPSPVHGYPGLSPDTARPLWRGREEAAAAAGRRGCPMNIVQPETQETGEGGAVSASPLPVSPSPRGAILP